MSRQKLQGSMFHRRLMLLWGLAVALMLGLVTQMTRLAVGQGAQRRAAARSRLDLVTVLPTTRGRILDRKGRVLAVDRPSYDVTVSYDAVTGAWALGKAAVAAEAANRDSWSAMSPSRREAAVAELLPPFEAEVEEIWRAVMADGNLDRPELERRLDAIKREVQRTAAVVWDRQLRQEIKFGRLSPGDDSFRPRPILEQTQKHVVLPRVPDRVAFAFRRLAQRHPDLVGVDDAHRRDHPWTSADVTLDRMSLPRHLRSSDPITIRVTGVADHILGSMREEVWAADVNRRPFRDPATGRIDLGGYRVGDEVGSRGLERTFEDHLRGERGVRMRRIDSGEVRRDEPHTPGRDLHLTIDVALQARVQAIMSPQLGLAAVQQWQAGWSPEGTPRPSALPPGTPLNGAAVVLEVETGEILALVSMPTIAVGGARPEPCRDGGHPLINRPVEAIYPPGSIIKPLVLAAVVGEGVHRLDEPVECKGHYLPDRNDIVRCWIYRQPRFATHGAVAAEAALARSCNIYFYTMSERLGMARLTQWLRRFGLGAPFDVGLLDRADRPDGTTVWVAESGGSLPTEGDMARLTASGELRFASIIMGIGQGPVTWTPVHAANAYATIARRGRVLAPTLVRNRSDRFVPPPESLDLDERLVETILEGLRESVSEPHGTGHHITYPDGKIEPIINAEGVTVWGKTGTAQAPPASVDLDCDGREDVYLEDPSHAWFVGLVGRGDAQSARPEFAIAVVMENGGSGGRTAGPIANEIIRALQSAGYLADDST